MTTPARKSGSDKELWDDFLLSLKDPTKQNSGKKAEGNKSKRPAQNDQTKGPAEKKPKKSPIAKSKKSNEGPTDHGYAGRTEDTNNSQKRPALKKDTTTEPVAKKNKTSSAVKPKLSKDTLTCHLLHTGNLPYSVVFKTKPNVTGVYKIAYEKKAIFVGNPSGNVIKQLRKHFTKHGNSEVYNFMTTLSEDEKEQLTVFWLDEITHQHTCGKSFLKCIEGIQGSKPRFNTRKATNDSKASGSRDSDMTSSLALDASRPLESDDDDVDLMSTGITPSSNTPHQAPIAMIAMQRRPIQSTSLETNQGKPTTEHRSEQDPGTPFPVYPITLSQRSILARPAARITPVSKEGKGATPSRKKVNARKKKSGASWNPWTGLKGTLNSVWSWMFGK